MNYYIRKSSYIDATIIEIYHALYNVELKQIACTILNTPLQCYDLINYKNVINKTNACAKNQTSSMLINTSSLDDSILSQQSFVSTAYSSRDSITPDIYTKLKPRKTRYKANDKLSDKHIICYTLLAMGYLLYNKNDNLKAADSVYRDIGWFFKTNGNASSGVSMYTWGLDQLLHYGLASGINDSSTKCFYLLRLDEINKSHYSDIEQLWTEMFDCNVCDWTVMSNRREWKYSPSDFKYWLLTMNIYTSINNELLIKKTITSQEIWQLFKEQITVDELYKSHKIDIKKLKESAAQNSYRLFVEQAKQMQELKIKRKQQLKEKKNSRKIKRQARLQRNTNSAIGNDLEINNQEEQPM